MPTSELYLCAHAAPEHHATLVVELLLPLARSIRDRPELLSLFFVRMNVPTWQVRLRVVGEETWLRGAYRDEAEARLEPFVREGIVATVEWTRYEREVERYGGEEGMELAETIYHHDSLACLEWLALERDGRLGRTRREIALLLGERYADLLGLEGRARARFYHFGYGWTREMETWDDDDVAKLEQRYQQIEPAMAEMLDGDVSRDPDALWGGPESRTIAERLVRDLRPSMDRVVEGARSGRIHQHLAYLGWSYTHLPCNRLGLPPLPEAILRYLQHRYHQEHHGLPGPQDLPRLRVTPSGAA